MQKEITAMFVIIALICFFFALGFRLLGHERTKVDHRWGWFYYVAAYGCIGMMAIIAF